MRPHNLLIGWMLVILMVFQGTPAAWGSFDIQTDVDPGKVQITGTADPGAMIAFLITEQATGNRRYLEQIRSDSSGNFALTIPLSSGSCRIEATSGAAREIAEVEVPPGDPDPGGGGGGSQETMTLSIMVSGDSQRGLILPRTYREIQRGDSTSALELVQNVLTSTGISFEIKNNAYISSISGLKEKDRGPLSGWMFRLNGSFPQVGVADYMVQDGDSLEFVYTCDGGKDVGDTNQIGIEEPEVIVEQPPEKVDEIVQETPVDLSELNAQQAFDELARRGIIKGSANGLEPERMINRAEFIALLSRAGAFENAANPKPTFMDVEPGQWFFNVVEGAVQAGLINGFNGSFQPNRDLTRYQAAAILKKLGGVSTSEEQKPRDYEQMPEWARSAAVYVLNTGLMKNCSDGAFQGANSISRIEAADILWRYMVKRSQGEK